VRLPPGRRLLRHPALLTLRPACPHCRCRYCCWLHSRQRPSLPQLHQHLLLLLLLFAAVVAAPLLPPPPPLLLCWMPLPYRLHRLLLLLLLLPLMLCRH
jgi:hypothetical protein